jgi:hypothetical protein
MATFTPLLVAVFSIGKDCGSCLAGEVSGSSLSLASGRVRFQTIHHFDRGVCEQASAGWAMGGSEARAETMAT